MRLKSLEIKGFKSFGNPTTLYFDENVTGVVGPNGSGKSNVVDAFRWVLGEQKSKELRLEQMADVLFNGADKKQQANFAEVSITFDNTKNILPTEFNTVKITRALYRSGESEYRINDTACRLKDIHLLLMDTGIGSNSYSIIELGMVDDILSDKENARRRMFEQAAGISKFKKRKKETIQKLKLTNDDLERIEDLLFEIGKNLKDLEKQAKRTKKYFEIKERYKESSIILYKLKWDRLEEGVISLNEQVEQHKTEYNKWTTKLAENEAKLEEEKRKNLEGEKNLSDFQRKLNELIDNIRRSENERNLLAQKIKFAENSIKKATEEIATSEPLLKDSLAKSERSRGDYKEKELTYANQKETLDQLQARVNEANEKFQSNKKFQEEKFRHLRGLQNQIFDIDKTIAVAQNKIDNVKRDQDHRIGQIQGVKEGLASKMEALSNAEKKIHLLEREIQALAEKEQNRKQIIENTTSDIDAQKDAISKLSRKVDALSNERNLIQSMVQNLEGFSESVKFLHSKWDGEKVLLSDVINTEERYRAAVEQVLHPFLNYFIVENIEEAKSAIGLLKNSQKGKAQFFLLDQIKKSAQKTSDGLTSLASVVDTDPKYQALINTICGDVYLGSEAQIYDPAFGHFNLIEEKGGLWRNQVQIAGGSVGLFEGKKIGRKKRIEQLEKEVSREHLKIDKEKIKLEKLVANLQAARETNYDVEIRIKERLRSDVETEAVLLKSQLDNAALTIESHNQKITALKQEEKESQIQLKASESGKVDLERQLLDFQTEVAKQDSAVEQLSQEVSTAREAYNVQNIKLIQAENYLEGLRKEINYEEQKERDLKQKLYDAAKSRKSQEQELEMSNSKLIKLTDFLQEQYTLRTSEQDDLTKAEQDYFKARAQAGEIEDEIRAVTKSINDKQFVINQIKDKLNDYKFKKNSIKERINIEFEYKISDLFEVGVEDGVEETELELQVEKFKRRLDNYGDINPMALEAYDEMELRFNHITEQRDDITKAKISLMKTIGEIEDTATKLFLESFDQVRKHFVVVFRSLFTQDDDCDLVLLDPDDPLSSKIEIIAKPKGKRPKSLSQLSGGEKTLTATALLFSLYLLKPAPFCIFDEVDAPLDDTNIQKFANIIRAFSDKSQFIIVTHNKATMAEVDVLYGVFMQKKGISSVSAVDFRSYEDKGTVARTELKTF